MRKIMRFVHIADVHLGMSFKSASFSQSYGNKKRDAIKKNLKKVMEYIKNNQIDLLLIAGDFLEGDYVEISDLLDIKYLFESIPNTAIVIMAGNHDPMSCWNNPYKLVSWPEHVHLVGINYEVVELDDINTSVVSVSWDSKGPLILKKSLLEEQIEQSKNTNKIVMLHGDAYLQNDYFYMDVNYLDSLKVDYVALGHIHKPDIIKEKVVYPGSLEPLDFSENYDHGFIVGEIMDGKLHVHLEPSMVLPMVVIPVDITGCESYLEIVDKTKEKIMNDDSVKYLSNIMIRISLQGEKNPYIGHVKKQFDAELKELIGTDIVYIEVRDKTIPGYDIDVLYDEHEKDIIGHYIRAIREKGLDDDVNNQALSTGITLLLEAIR